jgi:quinol-cytochrome oxidoreductase complex cytochrome b subunit
MSTARWFADRLGLTRIQGSLAKHTVPRHGFMFYLGGITLFLLVVQVASGILMTLYYQPDAAQAHASVERIVGEVAYGDLVHQVHVWAADLFVASLLLHVLTVMVRRSFRPPHEISWLSGVALLLLGVGQAFTGAILPWSQQAYTDARVGSEFARYVPIIGGWLHRFMRGGEDITSNTLGHAFGFHVAALPAAMTLVVAGHLFFMSRHPVARPPPASGAAAPPTIPLYPDFFLRLAVAMTGVMVLVLSLAIFVPRSLGVAADPRVASVGAVPPWYLMPVHAIVRAAPKDLLGLDGPTFLVGAACILGLVFICLPFIDRRGSRFTAWLAWFVVLALILLSIRAIT